MLNGKHYNLVKELTNFLAQNIKIPKWATVNKGGKLKENHTIFNRQWSLFKAWAICFKYFNS